MRTALRLAALFIALVSLVVWLFGGPNIGWTKMPEAAKINDTVTGREIVASETGFLPGLDFLAVGLVGVGIVWGMSFLARKQ